MYELYLETDVDDPAKDDMVCGEVELLVRGDESEEAEAVDALPVDADECECE